MRDHRGNGKVERMIRTINEQLKIDKDIVLTKEKSVLSRIVFAQRTEIAADGKSAFERHLNRKSNTLKADMVKKFISEADPKIEQSPADFREEKVKNAEWEVSHENPTTRKCGQKTRKPNCLGDNVMVKTIDREDTLAEEK